jgi:MFS transporter, DHA1 family, multidrug resistance protein B
MFRGEKLRFHDFHINIKIRIIESFLSRFVGNMIFPFMAIYLANFFGGKIAGLLLLINVFIGIGLTFIGGYIADQYGRKNVMLVAEVIRSMAFLTMMISNSPWFQSPLITFFMMTVNSICSGLAGPANQAMLIDVSSQEQRKSMYSIMYWANNLSIAIGGIVGAILFKSYLFELFFALTIVGIIIVILVIFFKNESYVPNSVGKINSIQHVSNLIVGYKNVLTDKLFILFVIAGVLILSMELQLTNYISIRLNNDMQQSQDFFFWQIDGYKMMAILRTENTLLVVLLALFASKLTNKFQDRRVLVTSCAVFSIGYGVIAYSNNIWLLIFFMLILTIAEVFRIPIEQSYLANIPPENARSTYMAVNGLKFNLAMLITSLTITIGAFLPSFLMALIISFIGLTGTFIYFSILLKLEERTKEKTILDVI